MSIRFLNDLTSTTGLSNSYNEFDYLKVLFDQTVSGALTANSISANHITADEYAFYSANFPTIQGVKAALEYLLNSYSVGIITENITSNAANITNASVVFNNYSEKTNDLTIEAGVTTIDLNRGNTFILTLTEQVNKFNIINIPNGTITFTLVVKQTSYGNKLMFWNFEGKTLKWSNNQIPIMTQTGSKTDVYSFATFDGGSEWFGFPGGQNF
jgi:aspartate oxidase